MKVICIEGLDGVGKETISKELERQLKESGFRVGRISFPRYNESFGVLIKEILNGKIGDASKLDCGLFSPLYTLDRIDYFRKNFDKLNNELDYLILDRGFYSNFIYQASKIYYSRISTRDDLNNINEIYFWLLQNAKWELVDTSLEKAESIITIVLTLSEEDRIAQISSREEIDTNEANINYLNECRKFLNIAVSPSGIFGHYLYDKYVFCSDYLIYCNEDMRDYQHLHELVYNHYYIGIHTVEVEHCKKSEDMESTNRRNAKLVLDTVNNYTIFSDDEFAEEEE